MRELTKKQKLFVLREALRYSKKINPKRNNYGICYLVSGIAENDLYNLSLCGASELIPELIEPKNSTRELVRIGLTWQYSSIYWWPLQDTKSRVKYLEKLIAKIEGREKGKK